MSASEQLKRKEDENAALQRSLEDSQAISKKMEMDMLSLQVLSLLAVSKEHYLLLSINKVPCVGLFPKNILEFSLLWLQNKL